MSAVAFNDQETFAGHKIGISSAEANFWMFVAFGLTLMNWYHMSNSLNTKLVGPDTSLFFMAMVYFISGCVAVLEFPVTKALVTNYRLHQRITLPVFFMSFLLSVIIVLAAGGGIYSNMADADKKDIRTNAHETQQSSFEDRKRYYESKRQTHLLQAKSMSTESGRAIETSRANSNYYSRMASLRSTQSQHQSTRPATGAKTGTTGHWGFTIFISLLCSLGVVFISGYLAVYYKPLVGKPILSLLPKPLVDWVLNKEDIRSKQYEVDVLGGGGSNYVKMEKQASKSTAPETETSRPSGVKSHESQNRPAPDNSTMGAVSAGENNTSERSLNNTAKQGGKTAYSEAHYSAIKAAIVSGEIKPTQAPVKKKLVALNVSFVDDAARQKKAVAILAQLKQEGVIVDNPDYGKTGKVVAKYLLAGDVEAGPEVIAADEIGPYEVETRCGQCGGYDYTRVDNLLDSQQGIVTCSSCKKNYVGRTHLTKNSQSIQQAERNLSKASAAKASRSGVTPLAGAGLSVGEDGISPVLGLGAIVTNKASR